jgi:uncharacterized membrane protein YdjX (TVP38/TMEM64 family)
MPPMQKSFVVLSVQGETVESVETPPSRPSRDDLTRQDETNGSKESRSGRRNLLWECFSSTSNAFKSKRERNVELTAQLQEQEEAVSSNSSSWDNTSAKVPYAQVSSPQSSNIPPPHHSRERMQRQEQWQASEAGRSHPWNQSGSSLHSSLHNSYTTNINNNNNGRTSSSRIVNELQTPSEEEAIGSSRLTEFKAELKYLFADLVEYSKAKTWKKKILTVLLCIVSMVVFYDLLFGRNDYIVTWLHAFIVWMTTHHAAAVFAFVGIFVLSTLAFVPPTLLVFGAGYAFTMAMDNVLAGVTAAAISCFLGSCIGAIIAFLRSRYMMRDLVQLFANRYPLIRAIDQALKTSHGFWVMFLLRLCPIVPFNGLNYCCGITGVTLYDFTLSLVGIIPFQIYTIVLGATAGAIELQILINDEYTKAEKWAFIGFLITGILSSLIAIVFAWRLVKQKLRRELSLSKEEFEYAVHSSERGSVHSSERGSSAFSFHLQEGDNNSTSVPDGRAEMGENNDGSTAFQEEGEEWFWVWA